MACSSKYTKYYTCGASKFTTEACERSPEIRVRGCTVCWTLPFSFFRQGSQFKTEACERSPEIPASRSPMVGLDASLTQLLPTGSRAAPGALYTPVVSLTAQAARPQGSPGDRRPGSPGLQQRKVTGALAGPWRCLAGDSDPMAPCARHSARWDRGPSIPHCLSLGGPQPTSGPVMAAHKPRHGGPGSAASGQQRLVQSLASRCLRAAAVKARRARAVRKDWPVTATPDRPVRPRVLLVALV